MPKYPKTRYVIVQRYGDNGAPNYLDEAGDWTTLPLAKRHNTWVEAVQVLTSIKARGLYGLDNYLQIETTCPAFEYVGAALDALVTAAPELAHDADADRRKAYKDAYTVLQECGLRNLD